MNTAMWSMKVHVIYFDPIDYIGKFVLRVHEAHSDNTVTVSSEFITADTLNEIRSRLPPGVNLFPRMPEDDPVIIETWI